MIGSRYNAHRDNVIDLFKGYKEKRGEINDGVDTDFLEQRINSLKDGKFTLAVAGEVKAGKSTLINALLGERLLPSDILQATNAIVEIFKSETSFLKVKFADGKSQKVYDDLSTPDIDEAKVALQQICSVSKEFRDIPTNLINIDIINGFVDNKNLSNINTLIEKWEEKSKYSLSNKKDLIEKYISTHDQSKIPVQIEFGYPLQWEFDELRIVDSPGVNSAGGIQKLSYQYLEKANAIIFVHNIKPIESESFNKFVNNQISNRSKDTLFLVLTHAGRHFKNIEKSYSEAVRLYKDYIPKERILIVDSILKLLYNELRDGKKEEEIGELSEEMEDMYYKFKRKANKQDRALEELLYENSGFREMSDAIDKFSMKAPKLQLREILETIKKGFNEQEKLYNNKIKRLNLKKKNPQEFEREIDRINNSLEKLKDKMGSIKNTLKKYSTGKHSKWIKSKDKLQMKYPKLLNKSENIEDVIKHMTDGMEAIQGLLDQISDKLMDKIKEELKIVGERFDNEYKLTIPKIDLHALRESARKRAFIPKHKTESLWENWNILKFNWSKKSRTYEAGQKLDKNRFLSQFIHDCQQKFYDKLELLSDKISELSETYLESFSEKMENAIQMRQDLLKKEKNKKQTNKQIIHEIQKINAKKKQIAPQLKRIQEILMDMK